MLRALFWLCPLAGFPGQRAHMEISALLSDGAPRRPAGFGGTLPTQSILEGQAPPALVPSHWPSEFRVGWMAWVPRRARAVGHSLVQESLDSLVRPLRLGPQFPAQVRLAQRSCL